MDFSKVRNYVFLGGLLLVSLVFLYIVRPFVYPIFWAAVIAVLFFPLYQRLNARMKHRNLSALITLMLVAVIIILPLAIIGAILLREALAIYNAVDRGEINNFVQNIVQIIRHNSFLAKLDLNEGEVISRLTELSRYILNYILNLAKNFTQNSLEFVGLFLIMMYTLFFFVRDGEKYLKKLMYVLPLGDRYEMLLYKKFTSTANAALKGNLLVGVIQGIMGGILFGVVGIPGAIIWGIVMAALSIIPVTGSFLVWIPAGIIMFLTHHIWQGTVIFAVGVFVISVIDNLLRPMLVGKDLQLHPLLILFSTLGGLAVFGVSGFIIGPIVASLFMSLWEIYEDYYHKELAKN